MSSLGTSLTHSLLTHVLRWGSGALLLLAACTPGPASSADALAEATRLAGQEQRATVAAAQATANAAQRQAQETAGAIQATAMQATAGALRATEISVRATSGAVEAAALERNAQASATAAWLNGQLTAIPGYLAATSTRRAETAQAAARVTDLAGWALVSLAALALLGIAGSIAGAIREAWSGEAAALRAQLRLRDRVLVDVSQQQTGGANGNDALNQQPGSHSAGTPAADAGGGD